MCHSSIFLSFVSHSSPLFPQQVEPFLCDCVSISKLLAQAIAPFTQDMQTPTNLEETKKVLKKHQLKKRRTIDQLQIDELTSQGLKINKLIKQESEERYKDQCMYLRCWVDTVILQCVLL